MYRIRIAIVGLALLATACSGGGTTGDPTPATNTETATTTASSNAAEPGKLASVKPCELISTSEATQLALAGSPKPDKVAGSDSCKWIDPNGGVTVVLNPEQSVEDISYSETKTPAKFGKYEGFTVAAPNADDGLCHAVISVSDSSNVQVVASAGTSAAETPKACELATKSAEFVAAKL